MSTCFTCGNTWAGWGTRCNICDLRVSNEKIAQQAQDQADRSTRRAEIAADDMRRQQIHTDYADEIEAIAKLTPEQLKDLDHLEEITDKLADRYFELELDKMYPDGNSSSGKKLYIEQGVPMVVIGIICLVLIPLAVYTVSGIFIQDSAWHTIATMFISTWLAVWASLFLAKV
jgi:hypothetical protein